MRIDYVLGNIVQKSPIFGVALHVHDNSADPAAKSSFVDVHLRTLESDPFAIPEVERIIDSAVTLRVIYQLSRDSEIETARCPSLSYPQIESLTSTCCRDGMLGDVSDDDIH